MPKTPPSFKMFNDWFKYFNSSDCSFKVSEADKIHRRCPRRLKDHADTVSANPTQNSHSGAAVYVQQRENQIFANQNFTNLLKPA